MVILTGAGGLHIDGNQIKVDYQQQRQNFRSNDQGFGGGGYGRGGYGNRGGYGGGYGQGQQGGRWQYSNQRRIHINP